MADKGETRTLRTVVRRLHFILISYFLSALPGFSQGITIEKYFDEEQTRIRERFTIRSEQDPVLCGPYQSFYQSGRPESTGHYTENKPDSIWTYFYENGNTKMQGKLRNGTNAGLWRYYYENGTLSMKGRIFDNLRQGPWVYYYENGTPKMRGAYTDNEKEGIWNYFFEDGSLKAQAYYRHGKGWYKEFYPGGKLKAEGLNVDGVSDSTWTFYHENGSVKARGNYQSGQRIGQWTFFHENSVVSAKGRYIDGIREGKWTFFHENGEVSSEGALRKDKKEGYWKIFDERGTFIAEGVFKQDDGEYKEYYENGKLKAEGRLEDGLNHGKWIYYYETGDVEGICHYEHGSGNYTGYYADGTIKMKGRIEEGMNIGIWELFNEDGSLAGYYRPYYENDQPIYKLVDPDPAERTDYTKPEYKYKNSKLRYFDPVINEYRGVILATNPFYMFMGSIPLSIEYYIQERLGYEMQIRWLNDPFFKAKNKLDPGALYKKGFDIALRQKFYHEDGRFGMFYFGHEVRITSIDHLSNAIDSTSTVPDPSLLLKNHETRFEYSFLVGDRWLTIYGERWRRNSVGITLDVYGGLGFGYRFYEQQYPNKQEYHDVFSDLNTSNFVLSPRFGLHFGIIF